MRDQHCHCRIGSRGQSAAAIEAEPPHPQHSGTSDGHGHVVRWHGCFGETVAVADGESDYQGGDTRGDMHHYATGKIDHTQIR